MFYDPNYRNQIFWDTDDFSINTIWDKLKQEMMSQGTKVKAPGSKLTTFVRYGLLGMLVLTALSAGIAFVFTKSGLFTLVAGMCFLFFWFGWFALFIAIAGFMILPKRYTAPVEATCVGYSISSSGDSSHIAGLPVCPVFEYEFGGHTIRAFDGVYENINKKPGIGTKTQIMIDPDEPAEMRWSSNKNAVVFLFLAFAFAVVLSMSIFFIVLNDEAFMSEALGAASFIYLNIFH